jgi:hypothetical protein
VAAGHDLDGHEVAKRAAIELELAAGDDDRQCADHDEGRYAQPVERRRCGAQLEIGAAHGAHGVPQAEPAVVVRVAVRGELFFENLAWRVRQAASHGPPLDCLLE